MAGADVLSASGPGEVSALLPKSDMLLYVIEMSVAQKHKDWLVLTVAQLESAREQAIPVRIYVLVPRGEGAKSLDMLPAELSGPARTFASEQELEETITRDLEQLPQRLPPLPRSALLLMPYGQPTPLATLLSSVLENHGVRMFDINELARPGLGLMDDVADAIRKTDLVLADISSPNPNVMFELGYARALRKPAIVLREDSGETSPSDIYGFGYLPYDKSNPELLRRPLGRLVEAHLRRDHR